MQVTGKRRFCLLGKPLEVRNGAFVDLETGSQWSIEGKALSGPLVGNSLSKVPEAYVSFWFAFSQFYPDLHLWLP